MELNHLRHFFEVAKAESFTKASYKLRISQSSLSKSVALLEDDQGVKLFVRSKKGVQLTQLGLEIYEKCNYLFNTAEEIVNICRGKKELHSGSLKFGASDHIANYLLTPELAKLKENFPELVCTMYSAAPSELIKLILDNEVEYGLFFTKIINTGIVYKTIGSVKMSLVCHRDIIRQHGSKANNAQLKKIIKSAGLIGSIGS